MSNVVENNDWDISRCSKPFCCKEDAEEYMQAKNFEGMVLELNDGSIKLCVLLTLRVFILQLKCWQQ